MSFSTSRLTCYALLSAIEEDLRAAVVSALPSADPESALGEELAREAHRRLARDQEAATAPDLADLLPYVDLGDVIQILNRNRSQLTDEIDRYLPKWQASLQSLLPIRNRVAHTRPLDLNDLPQTLDIARMLVADRATAWDNVRAALNRLESDPSFVLTLDIRFPDVEHTARRHNLPLPDFDDTGLLGRSGAEKQLRTMLRGPYPVISVVGDGGVGKTALALKAAYDLLDDPQRPYDAVVWTTAKAAQITNTEISRIEGAIRDSLGMFAAAAHELAGDIATDPMDEVLAYMTEFRVLLILDNLETVLDNRLRQFLSQLPRDSKVLITSRIGLGSLELPLKLTPLEPKDGLKLLRAVARVRGVETLARLPDQILARYVERMRSHPLYIKWFVSVVQSGRRPEEVLQDSGDILDFCMSNVYDYLESDSREALRCLQALPGQHSQAEVAELTGMLVDIVQPALAQLMATNFVRLQPVARGGGLSSEYEVTEFAQTYLDRRHPLPHHRRQTLLGHHARLLKQGRRLARASAADPFAETSLDVQGPSHFSVAGRLVNAISLDERGESGQAMELVREAQALAPEYHETYRIEALLQDRAGDIGRAREAYEKALEHAAGSPSCLYHAARFMLQRAGEPERGLALLQQAARTKRDDPLLQLEIVRGHLHCGDMQSARVAGMGLLQMPELEPTIRRTVVDLVLKSSVMLVQRQSESEDWGSALETLEDVADHVMPFHQRGEITQAARIQQAWALAGRCAQRCGSDYLRRAAERLQDRFSAETNAASMLWGRIVKIEQEKGFGWIASQGRRRDIFFHRTAVKPSGTFSRLALQDEVCFSEGVDNQGRPCATNVVVTED